MTTRQLVALCVLAVLLTMTVGYRYAHDLFLPVCAALVGATIVLGQWMQR